MGRYLLILIKESSNSQTFVMDNSTLRVTGESYSSKTTGCSQGACNSCLDGPGHLMQVEFAFLIS